MKCEHKHAYWHSGTEHWDCPDCGRDLGGTTGWKHQHELFNLPRTILCGDSRLTMDHWDVVVETREIAPRYRLVEAHLREGEHVTDNILELLHEDIVSDIESAVERRLGENDPMGVNALLGRIAWVGGRNG